MDVFSGSEGEFELTGGVPKEEKGGSPSLQSQDPREEGFGRVVRNVMSGETYL